MRVVIDLQGAQGGSRNRGIGRYSLAFVQALLRTKGEHEILIVLNGLLPSSIEPIRGGLKGLIAPEKISIFKLAGPVLAGQKSNTARRLVAELMREEYIASLAPDFVIVTSLFEGFGENIVTSIGEFTPAVPTAVILYDLIPLIHRQIYLRDPNIELWYENKITQIRNADLLLAISGSSRQEALDHLGIDDDRVINILSAGDNHFTPKEVSDEERAHLAVQYGLTKPFLMYTGGIDHRKNIEGLIESFAALPEPIRTKHQLAVVCSMQSHDRERLTKIATNAGLIPGDFVFTGFIPDVDLLLCYRACKAFVFPSWHEGFGLPALEAMMCGKAVIASNRSSLPEVIGLEEALFDPFDKEDLTAKVEKVLTDEDFRAKLELHSRYQAGKFSWDETANKTWQALEKSFSKIERSSAIPKMPCTRRPRIAVLTPLPPEPSGISDYCAELLPYLARYYKIDVITSQAIISDAWINANCRIRTPQWFLENGASYDRILYHFGNSHFHKHMFDLLQVHPGVVALHDFYLSGVVAFRDITKEHINGWTDALVDSHGWSAAAHRYEASDTEETRFLFPCNIQVLQDALGVISHSEYSKKLAQNWYGEHAADHWKTIPHLRKPLPSLDRNEVRRSLGFNEDDIVVCSFGLIGPTKKSRELLQTWLASPLAQDPRCKLIFVGQNDASEYGAELERLIRSGASLGHIEITGWADVSDFRRWLCAADIAVQLRGLSRGETSGTVLDCMNFGLPTIVNANGSMAELPVSAVYMLRDQFTEAELLSGLMELTQDKRLRSELGSRAAEYIRSAHRPAHCAELYAAAIEEFHARAELGNLGLLKAIGEIEPPLDDRSLIEVSNSVSFNSPPFPRLKRLFVDVSQLDERSESSEIRLFATNLLTQWLRQGQRGYIIEPVYATQAGVGFRYARRFTSELLGLQSSWPNEDPVEVFAGDSFLLLHPCPNVTKTQKDLLAEWYTLGIPIFSMIYDLGPISHPELYDPDVEKSCSAWLEIVSRYSGSICIGRATARQLEDWLNRLGPVRDTPFEISSFDMANWLGVSEARNSSSPDSRDLDARSRPGRSYVMLGPIDRASGHEQVLSAFEGLWAKGVDIKLTIVGSVESRMTDFASLLRVHPENGRNLVFCDESSLDVAEKYLSLSSHFIAAAECGGITLYAQAAAQRALSIIARDTAVFREFFGAEASYFSDTEAKETIAELILGGLNSGFRSPSSPKVFLSNWSDATQHLLSRVFMQTSAEAVWRSDGVFRIWGNDPRMSSQVGIPFRRTMRTSGEAGYLVYGPYADFPAGPHLIKVEGSASHLTGQEFVDVASELGNVLHLKEFLNYSAGTWELIAAVTFYRPVKGLEIRVWVDSASELTLDSIEISKSDAAKLASEERIS